MADGYDAQYNDRIERLFVRLAKLDPATAREIVRVFGNRHRAAHWIVIPNRALRRGDSPLRAIARGRAKDVLVMLHRIEHGLYS